VEIVKLSPFIPVYPSKKVLEKSGFFSKGKKPMSIYKAPQRKSYTQATDPSILEIVKLKKNYPNLLVKKIESI